LGPISASLTAPSQQDYTTFRGDIERIARDLRQRGVSRQEAIDAIRNEVTQSVQGLSFVDIFGSQEAKTRRFLIETAERAVNLAFEREALAESRVR
jgi:hypothetical protein